MGHLQEGKLHSACRLIELVKSKEEGKERIESEGGGGGGGGERGGGGGGVSFVRMAVNSVAKLCKNVAKDVPSVRAEALEACLRIDERQIEPEARLFRSVNTRICVHFRLDNFETLNVPSYSFENPSVLVYEPKCPGV